MAEHAKNLRRQTNNAFLNMYQVDGVARDGSSFPYYFATRREPGDLMWENGILRADGIVIYAVSKEQPDHLLVLRQFRYPVNDYVYEIPAGLVDAGEKPEVAAVREVKEETGLQFTPVDHLDPLFGRAFIQSQGMADECNITTFGYVEGTISLEQNEQTEDIQVYLADKKEVKRILSEEKVSIRAAYLMVAFLRSNPEEPFEFLRLPEL